MKPAWLLIFCLVAPLMLSAQADSLISGEFDPHTLDTVRYSWLVTEQKAYTPDDSVMQALETRVNGVEVVAVMGLWCSDSRLQFPRFLKIWDLLGGKISRLIIVDKQKKTTAEGYSSLNISYVPTFIFYRDGKELGRIVETPMLTLEKDILNILQP